MESSLQLHDDADTTATQMRQDHAKMTVTQTRQDHAKMTATQTRQDHDASEDDIFSRLLDSPPHSSDDDGFGRRGDDDLLDFDSFRGGFARRLLL